MGEAWHCGQTEASVVARVLSRTLRRLDVSQRNLDVLAEFLFQHPPRLVAITGQEGLVHAWLVRALLPHDGDELAQLGVIHVGPGLFRDPLRRCTAMVVPRNTPWLQQSRQG